MKYTTAVAMLIAGASINEVSALFLQQRSFLVEGETVSMWIKSNDQVQDFMFDEVDEDNMDELEEGAENQVE